MPAATAAARRHTWQPLRMRRPVSYHVGLVVAVCVALAAGSLLVSATPGFDAWGWALWGRELTGDGAFSTASYPSWKPLPALVDTVWSAVGPGAEPTLWLVTARAGALLALVLAGRLAARFGGPTAGILAAVGLALAPVWWSQTADGSADTLLVAIVLGAVDRHLDGHRRQALALILLAALLRPETWPFLVAYSAWTGREASAGARLAIACAVGLVPVLWFGGDWLGSGSPWTGGRLARLSQEAQDLGPGAVRPGAGLLVLGRGLTLAAPPLLVGVLVAVTGPAGRHRGTLRALTAGALALIVIVAGEAVIGFAGLPRFALSSAAVLSAVGAVGVTQAPGRLRCAAGRSGPRRVLVAVVAATAVAATGPAVAATVDDLRAAEAGSDVAADTRVVLRELQVSGMLAACRGRVAAAPPSQPAVALVLDRPVAGVAAFGQAQLVITPAETARWPEVQDWMLRHRRRVHRVAGAGGVLAYGVCGRAPRRGRGPERVSVTKRGVRSAPWVAPAHARTEAGR